MTNSRARSATGALICALACALASCSDALLDEMTRIARAANEPTATPATGSTITAHETITLAFPAAMDAAAVALSGDLAASYAPTWSEDGKTIALNGGNVAAWAAGTGRSLTVAVTDGDRVVSFDFSYDVFDGVCVSTGGSDGNAGTVASPLLGIEAAVTKASQLYAGRPSAVRVAEGTYAMDSSGSGGPVDMVEGVSLYGGYDAAWSARDPDVYLTTIQDTAATDTLDLRGPIRFPEGVTSATTVDGFTIKGPPARKSAAIMVDKAAPTISGNRIVSGTRTAGTLTDSAVFAIHVSGYDDDQDKSVVIRNNVVNAGRSGGSAYYLKAYGVFITGTIGFVIEGNDLSAGKTKLDSIATESACVFFDNDVALGTAPIIARNRIDGGSSYATYGISCSNLTNDAVTVRIENNFINAGLASMHDGSSFSDAIVTFEATLIIRNNTILVCDPDPHINWIGGGIDFQNGSSCGDAIIENNILINPSIHYYDSSLFAIRTGDDFYPIASLRNNYFYGFDDVTTGWYSWDTGEGLANMISRIGGAAADNEETALDIAYYDSISGGIIMSGFMLDADYRPRSTAPAAVLTGGLDGAALGWPFSDDFDGAARSGNGATGWSRGYLEKD